VPLLRERVELRFGLTMTVSGDDIMDWLGLPAVGNPRDAPEGKTVDAGTSVTVRPESPAEHLKRQATQAIADGLGVPSPLLGGSAPGELLVRTGPLAPYPDGRASKCSCGSVWLPGSEELLDVWDKLPATGRPRRLRHCREGCEGDTCVLGPGCEKTETTSATGLSVATKWKHGWGCPLSDPAGDAAVRPPKLLCFCGLKVLPKELDAVAVDGVTHGRSGCSALAEPRVLPTPETGTTMHRFLEQYVAAAPPEEAPW
jgi:hypothetical protein